ncbi:MAG: MCE family protein [Calditrichaeota bacterium]|nr:MAG: MCE family protein [Calditrichota bacterium]
MDFKANEVKAGVMIVVSVVLLIGFLVVIFGIDFGAKTKQYETHLAYVGGIHEGSLVKFGGMDVGMVKAISLPGEGETKIGVTLEVDEKTPVRVNSLAFVTSVGIMADQHIEITTGSPDADLLPPGSVLQSKEVLSFSQMSEPLAQLNKQFQVLLNRVSDIFNEENRAHLSAMMANLDKIMAEGGDEIISIVSNMNRVSDNLAEISEELNSLLSKNEDTFDGTLTHLEETARETGQLIGDLRTTLRDLQSMLSSNSENILEIMENFQYASQNLEEFSRLVKERPWLLVRKAAPPQRKLP